MTRKSKLQQSKIWYPLLFAGFTAFGMLVGFRMSGEQNGRSMSLIKSYEGEEGKIGRLEELLRFIESKYVDEVDEEKLMDAATIAIFDQLDPHSVYIPATDIGKINQRMSGYYRGVGIETIVLDDTLRITKVMEGSPAEKASLSYGDRIINIQDTMVAGVGMAVEDQWALLKVDDGQSISMQLLDVQNQLKQVEIKPEKIQYPNVDYFYIGDNAYMNIEKFSDDTYEEIVKALEYFQKDKIIESLIIDLRNNPGGYLQEATKILNQLFEEDKRLLVYTQGKNNKSEYKTTGRPFYRVEKLAVIINRNSASASEIIAGAVQDWDQGIIVGEQSYGKGLVQDQFDLNNGGSIRLTTARYFTPSGRYIQTPYDIDQINDTIEYKTKTLQRPLDAQGGIMPDYVVQYDDVMMKTEDITRRTVVSEAFSIVNRLGLRPGQMPDFNAQVMVESAKENEEQFMLDHGIVDPAAVDLHTNLVQTEILYQLGLQDPARLQKYARDPFILKAQEVLNFENIFADFLKD